MKWIADIPIEELPVDVFGWLEWIRGADIWVRLRVASRYYDIIDHADTLRAHAIGWARADDLWCRPKRGEMAVMFLIDDEFMWTHFSEREFNHVFG